MEAALPKFQKSAATPTGNVRARSRFFLRFSKRKIAGLKIRHVNFKVRRTIGADHPSLPGHFPGVPIVPGVVILDEILAALTEWRENSRLTVIRAVKFLVPLKPGQPFTICLSASQDIQDEVEFCCRVEGRVIVEGRLQVSCGAS